MSHFINPVRSLPSMEANACIDCHPIYIIDVERFDSISGNNGYIMLWWEFFPEKVSSGMFIFFSFFKCLFYVPMHEEASIYYSMDLEMNPSWQKV